MLIDGKGRLFGKINIFDLFVLCLLAASIFLAFRWVSMAEDPSWINVKTSHTRCIAVAEFPDYMADLVKEGDESVNYDGVVVAKIEKVLGNDLTPAIIYQSKDGEKIFYDTKKRNITVELDLLSYRKKGDTYAFVSDTSIKTGTKLAITTKKYSGEFAIHKVLETLE